MKVAELNNFALGNYYQSAAGVLPGLTAGFAACLMVRLSGPGGFFVGNLDDANTDGWGITVAGNPIGSGANIQIGVAVYESNVKVLPIAEIYGAMGQVLIVHMRYNPGTNLRIFAQGTRLLTEPSGGSFNVSAARFGLGNNPTVPIDPSDAGGFLGFGFCPLANCTETNIVANAQAILQAGKVVSAGLTTPYTYLYDADSGAAATLANKGSAGTANLTKVGSPAASPIELYPLTPALLPAP